MYAPQRSWQKTLLPPRTFPLELTITRTSHKIFAAWYIFMVSKGANSQRPDLRRLHKGRVDGCDSWAVTSSDSPSRWWRLASSKCKGRGFHDRPWAKGRTTSCPDRGPGGIFRRNRTFLSFGPGSGRRPGMASNHLDPHYPHKAPPLTIAGVEDTIWWINGQTRTAS